MMKMISNGRFQEIKGAGTFALSLSHEMDQQQSGGLCFEKNACDDCLSLLDHT